MATRASTTDSPSQAPPYSSTAASNPNTMDPSTNEEEEDVEVQQLTLGKKRKKTSVVWEHFNAVETNGKKKAICKGCNKSLSGDPRNGTSHLHEHIKKCVGFKVIRGVGQNKLQFTQKGEGKGKIMIIEFNQEVSRQDLCNMVVMHEYPLSIVEHEGFKKFVSGLQPSFKLISRNTLKSDILKMFEFEKNKTMSLLHCNKSRVSITTDMWTAQNQKKGFMAITTHWIDTQWNLQSRILRFIYVPAPHTAEVLCDVLLTVLVDWNIDTKLTKLTVDNCTTNDAMIDEMKRRLQAKCFLLHGKYFHMRCVAHILNLIVRDGMDVIQKTIENIRESVVFWRATPKRIERFVEVCQQKEVPYTKALVQDCKTRWNSTFLMLDVALLYEEVFERLSWLEPSFKCCPSSEEWKLARIICSKLSLFYEVTLLFSGNKYPTSNVYFPKVCQIRLALTKWALEEDENIKNMAEKMLEKFDKYWSVIHGIIGVAAILDPRYKMKVVECYYSLIYPDSIYDEIEKVRRICYELFREYEEKLRRVERNKSTSCGLTTSSHTSYGGSASLDSIEADIYEKWLANHGVTNSSQKNELDYYLEEAVMPRMENFDVLSWWKTNTKFSILQDMARDILAIPVSTVSSESAFSTSGRFITPHRNRLHPKTLEALMCGRDWLWAAMMSNNDNNDYQVSHYRGACRTSFEDEDSDDNGENEVDA